MKHGNHKMYISGPMTGIAGHNFTAFDKIRDLIKDAGIIPVSPADITRSLATEMDIQDYSLIPMKKYLQEDFAALFECDSIIMLKGWENSKGARAEHALAVALGLEISYE